MRTQEEIAKRANAADTFFGFDKEVLTSYLDFEHAKPFLRDGVTAESWAEEGFGPKTYEQILAEAKAYMEFGWTKVQDHRGISAERTVIKMLEWIWLLDESSAFYNEIADMVQEKYRNYGAPVLKRICEHFGWPVPTDEATLRMTQGLPCRDGCDEGCA